MLLKEKNLWSLQKNADLSVVLITTEKKKFAFCNNRKLNIYIIIYIHACDLKNVYIYKYKL